jgi:preprotein translocase subunit SecG
MFWFAQSATPAPLSLPGNVQVEMINQAQTYSPLQLGVLGIYFLMALGLILCVTFQTSKSEGLMQQSMAAPSGGGGGGKGKMTDDERLSNLTNNMAYLFLFFSILIAFLFGGR